MAKISGTRKASKPIRKARATSAKGKLKAPAKVAVPVQTIPEKDEDTARGRGRPTKYKPEYAKIAEAMCKLGATDSDLANAFAVSTVTIWRWTSEHQDFCNSVRVSKGKPDDRVERSLYQRAVGYSYTSEKVFQYKGEIVRAEVTEHVPPDPGAAMNWLKNRRGDEWRDVKQFEHGGPGDFSQMTDDELSAAIERMEEQINGEGPGTVQ